ncbi:unnamed protein product [Rhodiola kirilowii]
MDSVGRVRMRNFNRHLKLVKQQQKRDLSAPKLAP